MNPEERRIIQELANDPVTKEILRVCMSPKTPKEIMDRLKKTGVTH